MKRYWPFLVSAACVVVALLVWLLWSNRDDGKGVEKGTESTLQQQSPRESQPDAQEVPRRADIETPNPVSADTDQPHQTTPRAANASELKFATIDATLDEYARLAVIVYDQFLNEGLSSPAARMHTNLTLHKRIHEEGVHPELRRSLIYFHDAIPPHESSITALLVRAGRLPKIMLNNVFRLPNGELYTIKEPNTEVVVYYRARPERSEEGRIKLEELKRKKTDLLARQGSGEPSLEAELDKVRREIMSLENLPTGSSVFRYRWGDQNHPDFKIIELNLGFIERSD